MGNSNLDQQSVAAVETDSCEYPVIGEGASATVFKIAEDRVLKLFRTDLTPILLERELYFAQLAHDHGIPTPRPLGTQYYNGREGIVFEYFNGQNLDAYTLPRIWAHRRLTELMADTHAAIHRVEPRASDSASREARSQKALYRQLIGYSKLLSAEVREQSLAALDAAPRTSAFVQN
jgi:hypothetical protein